MSTHNFQCWKFAPFYLSELSQKVGVPSVEKFQFPALHFQHKTPLWVGDFHFSSPFFLPLSLIFILPFLLSFLPPPPFFALEAGSRMSSPGIFF